MDKKQQENRRNAARKFMHALDDLETVFKPPMHSEEKLNLDVSALESSQRSTTSQNDDSFDRLLNDAVQDIEQFMSAPPEEAD